MAYERSNIKLSTVIADELRKIIFNNEYESGDPFFSEREIVEKWECSRATAREALLLLEFEGLVSIKPGQRGGVFVREPNAKSFTRSFQTSINFNQITHEEIAEIRVEVESICAKLAAERATEEDLLAISEAMTELENEILAKRRASKNVEFHMAIVNATQNRILIMLMNVLESIVFEDVLRFDYTDTQFKEIIDIHRKIFEAIKNRDSKTASRRMRRHMEAYRKATSTQNI